MGGRPTRPRSAAPDGAREPEEPGSPSASLPDTGPWAEDVLLRWASEEAESRADHERCRRLLWGLGGLAAGALVTAGGLASLVILDALRTPPAGDEAWPPPLTGGVVPRPSAEPSGVGGESDSPAFPPPARSPQAGAAPPSPSAGEIDVARARVRRMEADATTRARRAFLAAKRAVARAWIRDLGHRAARLKATEAARSFAEAAEATRASRGPRATETREARKLAAYWEAVRDLIVAAPAR